MAMLIWKAPMSYWSQGDESAFFTWLEAIPGVVSVHGQGRELHIRFRSKRISSNSLRELFALYRRYGGNLSELTMFKTEANASFFVS
jgi:hypothetical protein